MGEAGRRKLAGRYPVQEVDSSSRWLGPSDVTQMRAVYLLRVRTEEIAWMQAASRDPKSPDGLKDTHGLVGSEEWWGNIDRGALEVHTISGKVTEVHSEHGQLLAFSMSSKQKHKTYTWCVDLPATVLARGQPVEVDYVLQERNSPFNGISHSEVVIEIRVT